MKWFLSIITYTISTLFLRILMFQFKLVEIQNSKFKKKKKKELLNGF